jgi:hypothetical protein
MVSPYILGCLLIESIIFLKVFSKLDVNGDFIEYSVLGLNKDNKNEL